MSHSLITHNDCAKFQLLYAYTHGKLTVISRSVRGYFQSSHGKLTVSSPSVHVQLAVSVNVLYLHLNVFINTNGHAYVTGRPGGRWYSSGEFWNEN